MMWFGNEEDMECIGSFWKWKKSNNTKSNKYTRKFTMFVIVKKKGQSLAISQPLWQKILKGYE